MGTSTYSPNRTNAFPGWSFHGIPSLLFAIMLCSLTSCGDAAGPDHTEPQVFVRTLSIQRGDALSSDTVLTVSGNFTGIAIHGIMVRWCKGLAGRDPVVEHKAKSMDLRWVAKSPDDVTCPGQSDVWEYEAFIYNVAHGEYSLRVLYDGAPDSLKYSGLVEVGVR